MKYLLKNDKLQYMGNKKQIIEFVKNKYSSDFFVQEYAKFFDTDYGKFKFALECMGLEISDKMSDKDYSKLHRRKSQHKKMIKIKSDKKND